MKARFERATIDDVEALINVRNLSFYAGYKIIKRYMNGSVNLVLFEKRMNNPKED